MLPLLFIGELGAYSSRSTQSTWDLGHVLLFFVLTVGVAGRRGAVSSRLWGRAGLILLVSTGGAVAIEWLQGFVGRTVSIGDVLLSVTGTALALLLSPWWMPGEVPTARSGWRLWIAALLVALSTLPTAAYLWDEARARAQMPDLARFGSELEMTRWIISGEHNRVRADRSNNWGLQLRTGPGAQAYWQLKHTPSDWSSFSALTMRVRLEGEPLGIQCVLYDWKHDRAIPHEDSDHYSERFELKPGQQEIRVDLERAASSLAGRRMELTDIASFWCRGDDAARPSTILVDYVQLQK